MTQCAWKAEMEGRFDDAGQILHDLHRVYGTPAVRAVVRTLLPGPAPTEVRHA